MRFFFRTWEDIKIVAANLSAMNCPLCGMSGALILHGFLRGWIDEKVKGIKGRRIRCKKSPWRNGCGHTFSIRVADTLPRRCFKAKGLWAFIEQLRQGRSIKSAWENCGIRLSLDTGYRLYRRLRLCIPVLRTHLCSRAPPPEKKSGAGSALLRTFAHLGTAFEGGCAVSAYQEALQRDFLATT